MPFVGESYPSKHDGASNDVDLTFVDGRTWTVKQDAVYHGWLGYLDSRKNLVRDPEANKTESTPRSLGLKTTQQYARVVYDFIQYVSQQSAEPSNWLMTLKERPAELVQEFITTRPVSGFNDAQIAARATRVRSVISNQFIPWIASRYDRELCLPARQPRARVDQAVTNDPVVTAWREQCAAECESLIGSVGAKGQPITKRTAQNITTTRFRIVRGFVDFLAQKFPGASWLTVYHSNPDAAVAAYVADLREAGRSKHLIHQYNSVLCSHFGVWMAERGRLPGSVGSIERGIDRDTFFQADPDQELVGRWQTWLSSSGRSRETVQQYTRLAAAVLRENRSQNPTDDLESLVNSLANTTKLLDRFLEQVTERSKGQRDGGKQAVIVAKSCVRQFLQWSQTESARLPLPDVGVLPTREELCSRFELSQEDFDVTREANRVADGIYLGRWIDSINSDFIRRHQIRSVLCLDLVSSSRLDGMVLPDYVRVVVPLIDGNGISAHEIRHAVNQLAHLVRSAPNVLVHCNAGRSRSPAVVAAYLATTTNRSTDVVLREIEKIRAINMAPDVYSAMIRAVYDGE